MRARRAGALIASLLVLLTATTGGLAVVPTVPQPVDPSLFRPITVAAAPTLRPTPTPRPEIIYEPNNAPAPTRPTVKQPEVKPKTEVKSAPAGRSATGVPTYYCRAGKSRCTRGHPDVAGNQLYAAAGPSIRIGDWRGRTVNVTANGKTIQVKLIDWCACGGDHFIDLYYDAFKLLGFPSKATVTW